MYFVSKVFLQRTHNAGLKLKVQTYFYKFVFLGPFSFVALSLYRSCNKVYAPDKRTILFCVSSVTV